MSGETVAAQEDICTLLEKCPNTGVFLVRIQTECG